ncbi:hypothetical protein ABW19_dt0207184 [Dactylella cylindrospora]|nr:hypothetical protein ABW19_dt0207184 [Dactylella cylindrospora]
MVLKRKRSDDDDAMSICSSSSFSRDSSTSPFSNQTMSMDVDAITQHHIPLGVHSRTLKRWRNSRPDEQSVFEYTMSKLRSAQKPTNQPTNSQTPTSPSFTPINHQPQQRGILSFFSRAQQHTHNYSANPLAPNKPVNKIACSDCDCVLETPFDDEEGDCYSCRGCYKKVCGTCSTGGEEWGMERRCLECALR